ncbi:MAG: DNA gyrase/topoisomerase IV subunit A [Bacteroidetes bacterium]|nr:DNA gyrase/topoisomerase IV subunit A [Bacteroidota bacterium]
MNSDINTEENNNINDLIPVRKMYENWFLDYASYVILERAVPAIEDGFKPVQRRIFHAMKIIDDGRYNKVANIIGQTMQYHPHGDASIGDAIINLGQKDLLIDTQGNWGDSRTGDSAAAARYIEARPSKFALDVLYNPQITDWQLSYDGRKKEPITLPVKFPLLLAQGAEGIAVGLSTKILPHNFSELIKASIQYLNERSFSILPDFLTGGIADFSNYNKGERGGKIRVRAKIEIVDKKTIAIKEVPYGITTSSLIDSILKAHQKGKIKIKNVIDNTAENVEIIIQIASNQSPQTVIDALYIFTDCEISISPNACIVINNKPIFYNVNDLLKYSTNRTKKLLSDELNIKKGELLENILFASLEKIFIENRIYRDIEECESWNEVIKTIDKGLDPFKKSFYRDIKEDDIVKLTEIKIKRISKYDTNKASENLLNLKDCLIEVENNINNLNEYTITYFKNILEKYGKGRERKTEIKTFANISASTVVANNQKLYINRKDGFIGYGLKKDEYICECSDIDDIIVFRKDGKFIVTKIAEKVFVGKDILIANVFNKSDNRKVYNLAYLDGKTGITRVKRFQIKGITRDKEYDLTTGNKNCKVLYLTENPNGEAEIITITLSQSSKARKKVFDFNFADIDIKGKGSQGNILTKYTIKKVKLKEAGISTLGGINIFFDKETGRINTNKIGNDLGEFQGDDKLLIIYKNGSYELTNIEINGKYDSDQISLIHKFDSNIPLSIIYYDGNTKRYYAKKFKIETLSLNKKFSFINDHKKTELITVTIKQDSKILIKYKNYNKDIIEKVFNLDQIEIKGWRAMGTKLTDEKIAKIELI